MARLRKSYIYALALLLAAAAMPAVTVTLAQNAKPDTPSSIPLFAEPAISPDR